MRPIGRLDLKETSNQRPKPGAGVWGRKKIEACSCASASLLGQLAVVEERKQKML
jgi:hypothetical protein